MTERQAERSGFLARFFRRPEAAKPRYRSAFGGLWVDRSDAHEVLERKRRARAFDERTGAALEYFIDHGYVIFPKAVAEEVIDAYLDRFERAWREPPPHIWAHSGGEVVPLSMAIYDRVAKVSDLHYYFPRAHEMIFAPAIRDFLAALYERAPVVFQTMTMRKGSEEPLHTDTGPLTLTEPMALAASWIALEDVREGAGALQFVPGSHRVPEVLNNGVSKGHDGDMSAYYRVLQETLKHCDAAGLRTEYFMAKKGDVLIWHADLMHGGAPIGDPSLTRKSLVSHYMPHGEKPTFYDASQVQYVPYPHGCWGLDKIKPTP